MSPQIYANSENRLWIEHWDKILIFYWISLGHFVTLTVRVFAVEKGWHIALCSPVPLLLPFLYFLSPPPCLIQFLPSESDYCQVANKKEMVIFKTRYSALSVWSFRLILLKSVSSHLPFPRWPLNSPLFGLGRSPGEGNDYPLHYSCLENSMDRGTWQATVHGLTKSWTWPKHTYRQAALP